MLLPLLGIVATAAAVVGLLDLWTRSEDAKAELIRRRLDAQREASRG